MERKKKIIERGGSVVYFIFRVLTSLLFMQHGAQKLFGTFQTMGSAMPTETFSLIWFAGVIEFFGGLLILLGVFTRPIAFIAAIEMFIAYFMVHAPRGTFPIQNQGELAALYFLNFLVITIYGAGKWGLEKLIFGKEVL